MRAFAALIAVCFAGSCACGDRLTPVPTSISLNPTQLDFGRVFVGGAAQQTVTLTNTGRLAIDGAWALEGEGFTTQDGAPVRADLGPNVTTVICAPPRPGTFDGVLRITLQDFEPLVVPLSCEGIAPPECPATACHSASWNVALGRCEETPLTDGTGCGETDGCLISASCQQGVCLGTARACDDGDPCTVDTCNATLGCQHGTTTTCPDEGPCRVGRCMAGQGCVLDDAIDGTPCGSRRSCIEADVCISGQCVLRDPPDGFICAPRSPCAAEGRCEARVCKRPSEPERLPLSWVNGEDLPDGGNVPEVWSDLFLDRDDHLTLGSYFFSPPKLRAEAVDAQSVFASARRCLNWLGWVVCGDLPSILSSPVVAIDPNTGQTAWQFNGAAALRPELNGAGVEFFLARLAVLSESELLVIYEQRVITEGVDSLCRHYAMVVLDPQGRPLRSAFLANPIFETCNHPHSYGVAIDASSNIYLAFTPSILNNPARSSNGTTIFSFSPALSPRWTVVDPALSGGELSVANGHLFHERSADVRSTSTGAVVTTLSRPAGLPIIGDGVVVVSEPPSISAYSSSSLQPMWSEAVFQTPPMPLLQTASWSTPFGEREVVLVFNEAVGEQYVSAFELRTGALGFTCALPIAQPPTMVVLGNQGVGVMFRTRPLDAQSLLCADCDPKYAQTRSQFGLIPLPGISAPRRSAWSGAWSDSHHSHRER